jgi:hypothetical protein
MVGNIQIWFGSQSEHSVLHVGQKRDSCHRSGFGDLSYAVTFKFEPIEFKVTKKLSYRCMKRS